MSLVKNHGPDVGQDSGISSVLGLLLNRKIGKKKMMIDDDDVALGGAAVHLGDKAFLPGAAFLAQAGVGAGVEFVPESAGLGQGREFSAVAGNDLSTPRPEWSSPCRT